MILIQGNTPTGMHISICVKEILLILQITPVDNPDVGFTFKAEGPLDLRLNPKLGTSSAEECHAYSRASSAKLRFTIKA
jgi:16S rRNA C1402 N4-methylase RsmH